jgi:hypothetical protein
MKSLAGSLGMRSQANSPHSIYLKLAMLEIERERRTKDLAVANATVARSALRIQEIEAEIISLKGLVEGSGVPSADRAAQSPAPPASPMSRPAVDGVTNRIFRF